MATVRSLTSGRALWSTVIPPSLARSKQHLAVLRVGLDKPYRDLLPQREVVSLAPGADRRVDDGDRPAFAVAIAVVVVDVDDGALELLADPALQQDGLGEVDGGPGGGAGRTVCGAHHLRQARQRRTDPLRDRYTGREREAGLGG